ncbi:hypothetical protein [Burkholderia cenocepacia]|uniref:hypothetical protein n=1 Tax=Burkholderia cenocepacia TaxID=95486 RepID=UPI00076CB8D5|nr:hypothetical protein [Burkholderia cenocepacia]KWU23383.1 hypothetical protein AS149_36965 [Burkholderia cenocepacia]
MPQPESILDEMTQAFEDSKFYFNGESPVERLESWCVWKVAYKAALPHRLPPVRDEELRALASDIASGFGGTLTTEQVLAIHQSFQEGLAKIRGASNDG